MNKKLWLGFAAVFVVLAVCDTIINTLLLSSAFAATASLWRSTADMKVWVFYVIYLFVAFFFTLIFSKGYEGKGVMEGVRYGIYIGMMMAISTAFGTYGAMPSPVPWPCSGSSTDSSNTFFAASRSHWCMAS